MANNFKEALEEQLERAGVGAYRLSQLSGVSKQTISEFLNKGKLPSWESAIRIALALNVSLDVFRSDDIQLPESAGRGEGG